MGAFNDPLSKKIIIDVSWQENNKNLFLQKEILISAWNLAYWKQTDFSGGEGFDIWSQDGYYSEDDGNIDNSGSFLKLKEIATSTYPSSGYLISSAFFVQNASAFDAIFWEENEVDNCDGCEIRVQIKTASDNSGSPGVWTSTWSGPQGDDGNETDYFSKNTGELINLSHNGDEWIKYKIIFLTNTLASPELSNISIFYQ